MCAIFSKTIQPYFDVWIENLNVGVPHPSDDKRFYDFVILVSVFSRNKHFFESEIIRKAIKQSGVPMEEDIVEEHCILYEHLLGFYKNQKRALREYRQNNKN